MRHLFIALTYTFVCTLLASSIAAADYRTKVVTSHIAKPATLKNQAIGRCVSKIQRHWNPEAKLVLKQKARLWKQAPTLSLAVNGWVWQDSERIQVSHECITNMRTKQTALHVFRTEDTIFADN